MSLPREHLQGPSGRCSREVTLHKGIVTPSTMADKPTWAHPGLCPSAGAVLCPLPPQSHAASQEVPVPRACPCSARCAALTRPPAACRTCPCPLPPRGGDTCCHSRWVACPACRLTLQCTHRQSTAQQHSPAPAQHPGMGFIPNPTGVALDDLVALPRSCCCCGQGQARPTSSSSSSSSSSLLARHQAGAVTRRRLH